MLSNYNMGMYIPGVMGTGSFLQMNINILQMLAETIVLVIYVCQCNMSVHIVSECLVSDLKSRF
jgi:hypothetical protein